MIEELIRIVLREARKFKGSEISEMTGINRVRVYRIVNYGWVMNVDELAKLMRALKLDHKERLLWEIGRDS